MSLNHKNPTLTDSWKKLKQHFNQISKQKIEDHFQINQNILYREGNVAV